MRQLLSSVLDRISNLASFTKHLVLKTELAFSNVSSESLPRLEFVNAGWIHAERFINKALAHLVYGPKSAAKTLQQALSSGLFQLFSPSLPFEKPAQEDEDLLLLLHQCPFLNVSVCEASLKYSLKGEAFLVVVYNPLAWPHKAPVQVPMSYDPKTAWAVKGVDSFH